ncbi:MAG: chemotaxis protein CheA [Myxococcota bacterium]|nr:chemotaxis protein CheA [Myxococcota bacterium]
MSGDKAQREFVSEVEDILERMRDDIARLAEGVGAGAAADPRIVNGLFRSAHSLKGLSGMFGFDAMSELAHHLEDVLDGLRMGRSTLDHDGLSLFDEAVTLISSLVGKLDDDRARSDAEESIATLMERVDAWVAGPTESDGSRESEVDLPAAVLRALTEYEEHRLHENVAAGRNVFLADSDFEILSFEEGLSELNEAIQALGEPISTLPSPGESPDSQIRFSILLATTLDRDSLAEQLDLPAEQLHLVFEGEAQPAALTDAAATEATASEVEPRNEQTPADPGPGSEPSESSLKSISDTVRVDIRKLDELMNLVGELVIQRASIRKIAETLATEPATARVGAELEKVHRSLERKLADLQASVLDVRMVPLRQVFDKISRVARRLRVDLGKEVRLDIRGADTELDKLIVEDLVDPLMHVVRNAFDHAIEDPGERESCGKPVEGRVRIEAFQRGNDVVIQVSDDGRGIDADKVLERALERGLVTEGQELSPREILDLVFHPGISTREAVSTTSGRGVGMDVVRSNIAALGGIVTIESEPGRYTTISMTLPITLAIMQALIVGVGSQRFAIPLNSVRETLLVDPQEIQSSDGRELLNLRGEPLLLRRLSREFDIEPSDAGKLSAVVLGIGDSRMGLLVERLEGQQDAVIKPIQGPVSRVRGVAGATELGEQGAVLVLDVSALVEDALRGREAA